MEKQIFAFGILIFVALLIFIFIPRRRNAFFGYKTAFALQNDDTAKEANSYFSKTFLILLTIGLVIYLLSIFFFKVSDGLMAFLFIILPIAISVVLTEKHLKKLFDENGKRK